MAKTAAPPNLDEIIILARQQVRLQQEVEAQEEALKELKAELRQLSETDLPAAMAEAGLTSLKLESGETVTVKPDMDCAIAEEDKAAAYDWLERNNYDGIIKTTVTVAFGRGELEKARKLATTLQGRGLDAQAARSVHWQTLKAFLLERTQAGVKLPMQLFGMRPHDTTVIKLPRKEQ